MSSRPAPAGMASVPVDPAAGKLSGKLTKPDAAVVVPLPLVVVPLPLVVVPLPLVVVPLPLVVVPLPLVVVPLPLVVVPLLVSLVLVLPALPELLPSAPHAESATDTNKQTTAAFLIPSSPDISRRILDARLVSNSASLLNKEVCRQEQTVLWALLVHRQPHAMFESALANRPSDCQHEEASA